MIYLIADDDMLIRFNMKSMLIEYTGESSIILEAKNGKELVYMCKQYNPDIVFADIQMPYLNGLEAIEKAKEEGLGSEFVIISGYADFAYAQKAITLGISNYLVKPISPSELGKILNALHKKLAQAKRDLNSHFQLEVYTQYSNYLKKEEKSPNTLLDNYEVYFEYPLTSIKNDETIRAEEDAINAYILKNRGYFASFYTTEGNRAFIYKVKQVPLLSGYFRRLSRLWEEKGQGIFYVHANANSLEACFEIINHLEEKRSLFLAEENSLLENSEINEDAEKNLLLSSLLLFQDALEDADIPYLKELLGKIRTSRVDENTLNLRILQQNLSMIFDKEISFNDIKELSQRLEELTQEENNLQSKGSKDEHITMIKAYIDKHYSENIGISDIADHFKLTPNYLSTLFHQKMKMKFIDYITSLRLEKAKILLLRNKNASVKDISLMVGYISPRHFSGLFQKAEGCTPSQYRNQNSRK